MMIQLKKIAGEFSVCKIKDLSQVNFQGAYVFIGKTDEEVSLVCQTQDVPSNTNECESGFMGLRVAGKLDFSLTGILSAISTVLAQADVSIFAVSTYDTDYIFVKKIEFERAISVLNGAGYQTLH